MPNIDQELNWFSAELIYIYVRSDTELKSWQCLNDEMLFVAVGLLLSGQVRNLSITYVDHSRLDLIWRAPAPAVTSDVTTSGILRYSVSCVTCSDNVTFIPARSGLNTTRLVDCTVVVRSHK